MTPRREKLIRQMEKKCPPGDYVDYCAIAEALERGDSEGDIMFMPEVFRWPQTCNWLREHL